MERVSFFQCYQCDDSAASADERFETDITAWVQGEWGLRRSDWGVGMEDVSIGSIWDPGPIRRAS